MKKLIILLLLLPVLAVAQTFPVANLLVTTSFTATGLVTTADLATQAANTVLANVTGSSASPTAVALPNCSATGSALNYAGGSGFTCQSGFASTISPTFTGIPTAPTAPVGTNTTQIATTAFVTSSGVHYAGAGSGLSTNTTLSAAQLNSWSQIQTFGITATLPLSTSVATGSTYTITGSVAGKIASQGSDTICQIVGGSCTGAAGSINIAAGETITLAANSGSWYITSDGMNPYAGLGCSNILAYGGNNLGSVDNSTAWTAALAAGPSGQACVYFPPGTYAFSGAISYTMPNANSSVSILGSGVNNTILQWAAGGGMTVNFAGLRNSTKIMDMTFVTGTANVGAGLTIHQNYSNVSAPGNFLSSELRNLAFVGSDFSGNTTSWLNYWNIGLHIDGVSNMQMFNLAFYGAAGTNGVGIDITGTAGAQALANNLTGGNFNLLGNAGIIYNEYSQGLAVENSNFVGVPIGIEVVTPNVQQDQLSVTNSQFNCQNTAILDEIGVAGLIIHGNYFLIPAANSYSSNPSGVLLQHVNGMSITGNVFQLYTSPSTGTSGIVVTGSSTIPGVITGNIFAQLATGVWLQAGSNNINVQSNNYVGNTNNTLNSGTANTIGGGSP